MEKTIPEIIEEIKEEICDKYCKYPEIYDEEAEGIPLCDSEHCRNCPLCRL